jgi:hypothetical protein
LIHDLDRPDEAGQSLIELVVVLPVLMLLLAAVCPLLASGIVKPWLDEKLWLRQFFQGGETLQSELEDAHGKNLIPMYTGQRDLEETTNLKNLGLSFPLLRNSFPGLISTQKVLSNHPEGKGITLGKTGRSDEKISRSLAMLTSTAMTEPEIPHRVRKLSILGIFSWRVEVPKKLDFEFFHLNLDALPETDQ